MAEVLRVFDEPVVVNGMPYTAQVAGRQNGHMWEGWLEFAAVDGSDVRRTRRETTQPDREALAYWAGGLSGTYLEGAMARTFDAVATRKAEMPWPLFESPAPTPPPTGNMIATERAVLDPFSIGAKGEVLLRQELSALRGWHLRNIIRAYDIPFGGRDLERLTEPELIELIVAAVQPA